MAYRAAAVRKSNSSKNKTAYWERPDPPARNGFGQLGRGIQAPYNYEHLPRRFGPTAAYFLLYLMDRTIHAYGAPEYVHLDLEDASVVLNVTDRAVRGIVQNLVDLHAVSRHPDHLFVLKVHPENFAAAPVRRPPCRPRKASAAEIDFRMPKAALVVRPSPPCGESAEMHFRNPEKDDRVAETYCPWNWQCPHLVSDMEAGKTLKTLKEDTSSSSSVTPDATTTEDFHVLPENPAAGNSRQASSDAGSSGNSRDRRRSARAGAGPGASVERLGARGHRDQSADAKVPHPDDPGLVAAPVPAQNQQNTQVLRSADVCPVVVVEAIAASPLGATDPDMANGIWRECRAIAPHITPDELARLVRTKASDCTGADRPHAYLRTALVNAVKKWLADRAAAARIAAENLAKEHAEARERYRAPDTEDYLKRALEVRYPFLLDESG